MSKIKILSYNLFWKALTAYHDKYNHNENIKL